LLRFPFLFLFI
jgi:hypothetical protein